MNNSGDVDALSRMCYTIKQSEFLFKHCPGIVTILVHIYLLLYIIITNIRKSKCIYLYIRMYIYLYGTYTKQINRHDFRNTTKNKLLGVLGK